MHFDTAWVLSKLGIVLDRNGKRKSALECFKKMSANQEAYFRKKPQRYQRINRLIGNHYTNQKTWGNNFDKAEQKYLEILKNSGFERAL